MELNGVANLHCIINSAEDRELDSELKKQLKDQLDVLERYMCAVARAHESGTVVPQWYEVRDNRNQYPKNGG